MPMTGFKAKNHPQQVLVHGAQVDVDERATPSELFAVLDRRFRFTVDAAALACNTKLLRYWTPAVNGLEQDWTGERVWCNPPFSDIEPWVEKAWNWSSVCESISMLLPASRTEQQWWQLWVEPYRDGRDGCGASQLRLTTHFLSGRTRFGHPGNPEGVGVGSPPFGCVLLVWRKR